jgi:hypothetical protein
LQSNRVVERDPFPAVHNPITHIWHSSNEGDIKELMFYLPGRSKRRPPSRENIEKAFRQYGVMWFEKGAREGWKINPRFGVRCHGGYPSPDKNKQGHFIYVITVRAIRTRPEVMKSEDAEPLLTTQPTGTPGVSKIYAQTVNLSPEFIERQVRNAYLAEAKMDGFRQELAQKKHDREQYGLPPFDPTNDIKEADGTDDVPDALIQKGNLHDN